MSDDTIQNPHPVYAELRQQPVFYSERIGMWVVSRYADVAEILRDRGVRFHKDEFLPVYEMTAEATRILAEGFDRVPTFDTNPPEHRRIRSFTSKIFTPARMRTMEPRIRAIAGELIEGFAADGRCEFVEQFAFQLPAMVAFDFLGVPREAADRVRDWSVSYVELFWDFCPPERQVQAARDNVAYWQYIGSLIRERRAEPRDDVFSILIQADGADGEPLTDSEIISICHHLVIAGHRTTTNNLASMMIHLLQDRSRWERVTADPALAAGAVEESLRMDAPVTALWYRTAAEVSFEGTTIPAGERVLVVYGSANHDESVYEAPEKYELDRPNANRHLAFGLGPHVCAGAPLARVIAPVAVQELARRLPNLRMPAQDIRYLPLWTSRGPEAVHLEWDLPANGTGA
ncbi:cytochrome P450 [Spirillospora sp. NPDC048819]|uniref:cytochrome P450 n=1 Tax=Spirillospora sp. NPDC048819 TaxID=3155268 RepID=UPI00340605D4